VKSFETTRQHISVFPNSDDQYSIKVTGTGVNPLLTPEAQARSSIFNADTGGLYVPKVMLSGYLFDANLTPQGPVSRSSGQFRLSHSLRFKLSRITSLNPAENPDIFQATYNESDLRVTIPRVTDLDSGIAYSVVLQYHHASGGEEAWLGVLSYEAISK
jgi:hypothetical protein